MNLSKIEQTAEYYQPIFDFNVGSDLVLLVNLEGIVIYGAYSIQNILGYDIQDFIGKNLNAFFPKSQAEFCKRSMDTLMTTKVLLVSESRLKHKNKKELAVEISGKIISYLGTEVGILSLNDITDRERLKFDLIKKTTLFSLVTSNMKDFIWMFDMNKKVQYASESSIDFLGYTIEELKGIDVDKIHTELSNQVVQNSLVSALNEHKKGNKFRGVNLEIEYVKKDGSTFFAEVAGHIIFNEENLPIGFGGVSRNIANRKKVEKIQEDLNLNLLQRSKEVKRANSLLKLEKIKLNDTIEELISVKDELTNSHKEITESITYAMTIQEALLTRRSLIDTWINNYFIYYEPKDNVGGDFYYVNKIKDHLIFAVADCTGHGIPGALITMIGITYLHDVVNRRESDNPGHALDILRTKIKTLFENSNAVNHNGMDIALCGINLNTHIMQYAGAFSPLWIIRDGELTEYKAVRNPIANYPVETNFTNNEIQLLDGDKIYLFSDGFKDQFGGERIKKFGRNRFVKLLLEISDLPMTEQNKKLKKALLDWKGAIEQIDDITVFGMEYNY